MGKISLLLRVLLVVCFALVATVGCYYYNQDEVAQPAGGGGGRGGEEEEGGGGEVFGGDSGFLLQESLHVVKTDAGNMRVLSSGGLGFWRSRMLMGLITMEPNSLFIPQYLDSSLILFVRRGFFISFSPVKVCLVYCSMCLCVN